MRIVSDEHIPFLAQAVQNNWPEVEICPMKPEKIDASAVRGADVLVVRTRTIVDEKLLAGSKVQLVCTATIGFDHIDTAYCEKNHILWTSCPGCNAQAVCDYIEEALDTIFATQQRIAPSPCTIGVVGVGHVGSKVADMAQRKGLRVLLNDPPKGIGVSLDEIAHNCDIITFHTPLSYPASSAYPTYHLCDEAFLARCKPGAIIINAARGGIVDEQALLHSGHPYILDTWENEPAIHPEVLAHATLASMHIAGYSVEGKRNASQMCLDFIAEKYHLPHIQLPHFPSSGDNSRGWLMRISKTLKASANQFETLRKSYPLR